MTDTQERQAVSRYQRPDMQGKPPSGALNAHLRRLLTAPDGTNPLAAGTLHARYHLLVSVAGHLNPKQVRKLLAGVRRLEDPAYRLPLLALLAPYLPPRAYYGAVQDIWRGVRHLPDPVAQAETLLALAPSLAATGPKPTALSPLGQALSLAQSLRQTDARVRALCALAPYVRPDIRFHTFRRLLKDIADSDNDSLRGKSLAALAPYLPPELGEAALDAIAHTQSHVEQARALCALAPHLPPDRFPDLPAQALAAIEAIPADEDRADALIRFVPNLAAADPADDAYPDLLKRALGITVSLARRDARAHVLTALAPYLTPDLQGEALAAVHSLEDERERARLLSELAPALPPDMLVASLAVAHTMRAQDARVHALSVLAHHVPASARDQTRLDALAAASNLPKPYERVRALIGLLDILPETLADQALTNALETTRLVENQSARVRALALLGPHLPSHLVDRVLEAAATITDPEQRLTVYMSLTDTLPEARRRDIHFEMLGCARQLGMDYKRARALVSVAPHLPPEMLLDLTSTAETLADPVDRVSVYVAVVDQLERSQRREIIANAWKNLLQIEEGYDRASALAALAPFLPERAARDLSRAIIQTIRSVPDDYDRASAITLLADWLVDQADTEGPPLPEGDTVLVAALQAALRVPDSNRRASLLHQGARLWQTGGTPDRAYAAWRSLLPYMTKLPLAERLVCVEALLPLIGIFAAGEQMRFIAELLGVR